MKKVYNEVTGSLDFASDGGKFTITAKADRIDETIDGHLNVLDYKTGKARTLKEIITGMAPQQTSSKPYRKISRSCSITA